MTVSVGETGYGEAEAFTYETYWYIGTVILSERSHVHGLFSTVYGVGLAVEGHHDLGRTEFVGYGLSVFVVFNLCAKCFAKCTEWYIGTVILCKWSCILHVYYFVVDDHFGGTEGHYYGSTCWDVFFTEGVGEGASIDCTVVSLNSYYDVSGGYFVGVNFDFKFTLLSLYASGINSYFSIFIGLLSYISGNSTVYFLSYVVISIYYRYIYSVVEVDVAFGLIEGEFVGVVCIYNS